MEDTNKIQLFDGTEEEAVELYQPVVKDVIGQVQKEFDKTIANLGITDAKQKDRVYETLLFNFIKEIPTPLEVIKVRKGADGSEYEYFDEHYTNQELDRLFPGWWTDEMKTWYDAQTQAYITTGYLYVEYTLPSGATKIRKVYAVGGAKVYAKKSSLENGLPEASQPEDRAIASFTRWKKLAGKQLGIGLDIYHQKVTPYLKSLYEKKTQSIWVKYRAELDKIAETIKTGKGMRTLLKKLATPEEYDQLSILLLKCEQYLPKENFEKIADTTWQSAIQDKNQIPSLLNQLTTLLNKIKKGEQNES